ncbi:MAG TPA: hypothetical protein VE131_11435 [Terriglobales bacterium]|nr:hypothetical protein [Terriglobales bacterium]
MRRFVGYLVFLAYVGTLSDASAAFVIKLRNGNEFVTSRYWQEGKQIMFDTYGGVFGIDKGFVLKIETSDKPVQWMADVPKTPEATPQEVRIQESNGPKTPARDSKSGAKAKREEDPILKDFSALKEKFSKLDSMLTSELVEFSQELSGFKRKVQASGKPNNYINEFTEAFKMGDALEAELKSRRQ